MGKTYNEYLYDMCNNTDLMNQDDVVDTMLTISKESIQLNKICKIYEKKLKEVLSAADFEKFIISVAKQLFADTVADMPDGEFKDFTMKHFDDITHEETDNEEE